MNNENNDMSEMEKILFEIHKDEMKDLRFIAENTENELMKHAIEFGKMTLKGTFVLNGTAAVATLTLFTNVLINKPEISANLFWIVLCFAIGSLFASLACMFSYYTQTYRQLECGCSYKQYIFSVNLRHLQETKDFYQNKKNTEIDLKKQEELTNKLIETSKTSSSNYGKKANNCMICVIISVSFAYVSFFAGIATAAMIFSF